MQENKTKDYFHGGHFLCPGCPGGILWRAVLQIFGPNCIIASGATCSNLPLSVYPTNVEAPALTISMASPAALLSGMDAALRVLRRKKKWFEDDPINLVAFVGDGATADIGFSALSSAAERNVNATYICFDNEAYMNTGIQRSSQTPYMAWTTTTVKGKEHLKKDMPSIMAAHDIPYTATASIGFHQDLIQKFVKARDKVSGFKYIHVLSPCPPGWRFPESKTVSVSRLAVETCIWPLYEVENGKTQLTYKPEPKKPIQDYLGIQGRFPSLEDKHVKFLQERVDQKWESLQC